MVRLVTRLGQGGLPEPAGKTGSLVVGVLKSRVKGEEAGFQSVRLRKAHCALETEER